MGGTKVTKSGSGDERIEAIRNIADSKQYAKVDGVMIDLFSASAIVKVYDALNDTNKEKFKNLPVAKMASVAMKLLK
jgi:hypothetical protein